MKRLLTGLFGVIALLSICPVFGSGGINVRKSASNIVFRRGEDDSNGAIVTTGTTTLTIYELQDDGAFKTYDFNDNTFKTTTVTTRTANMTNQLANGGATATGIWTYALSTLTGFTAGRVYIAVSNNALASPPTDRTEFQFGGSDGDVSLDGSGYVNSHAKAIDPFNNTGQSTAIPASTVGGQSPPANWSASSIDGSGRYLLQPAQTGVTIPNVTTVGTTTTLTNPVVAASVTNPVVASSVTGDVQGKVLGGGSSTITGDGVRASGVTGNVGGNVTGSTGSISGVAFPTNFNLLAIDGTGKVALTSAEHTAIAAEVTTAAAAATVDGTITDKQYRAVMSAIMFSKYSVASRVSTTAPLITTYYKQDGTTVIAVSTVTYNSSGQPLTRTWTFSNLP